MGEFEIIKEKNGKFTWRFVQGGTNRTIARSYDEYDKVEDLEFDVLVIKEQASTSKLNDQIKNYFQESGRKKKKFSFFMF